MPQITRFASHAGTWYSSNPLKLSKQIDDLLNEAPSQISGARFLIGPHAGYTYAGKILAETYNVWDTSKVKRVFILGPSHHVYFKNVAYVSNADEYETPFGSIPVDKEVVERLVQHDTFKTMELSVDEEEHSFEMHAPFIYQLTKNLPQGIPAIVPIMISYSSAGFDKQVALILSEYINDEENTFVISSDFCHWGSRFGYTKYSSTGSLDDLQSLGKLSKIHSGGLSIHKSIEYLDKLAGKIASSGSSADWDDYIESTGNTICGQKPISILLKTLEIVREKYSYGEGWAKFSWLGYSQSSKAKSVHDSSVSYYSGYATSL